MNKENISTIAQSQIDFFSGENGNQYTERNKDNLENCGATIIYNCLKIAREKNKLNTILEVGCGVGNNLSRVADMCNITGVDINNLALSEAQKKYPNGKFLNASLYELPFQDNSFDFVFTRGVLIHIPPADRLKALGELKRVSSQFIISIEYNVEDKNEFYEMVEWRGEKDKLWRINTPKYWEYFTDVELKEYSLIPEEYDASKNHICIVKKI